MPHAALRVGLIGAGRAGTVIARALERAGHLCVAVDAVSDASLGRAAEMIPSADVLDPIAVCARADLVIVAVPDDAIESVVNGLVRADAITARHFVMHLSGRHGVEVLRSASDVGATAMAVHPAMTLHGRPDDVQRLVHCPFAVTGEGDAVAVACALVYEMGGDPSVIREEDRVLYHAALAHASNHLVTLEAQAMQLLRSIGISDPGDFLRPLVTASVDRVLAQGDAALTGPIARGDTATVMAHLAALSSAAVTPSTEAAYRAMARATADRHGRDLDV